MLWISIKQGGILVQNMLMTGLSLVIPFYNEEMNLPLLCERLKLLEKALPCAFEVLFVNDGSTDGSFVLMESYCRQGAAFRLLSHEVRKGQTQAIQTGMKAALYDTIATLDADMEQDPLVLADMYREIKNGYDVVLGCRLNNKCRRTYQRVYAMAGRVILKCFFGIHLLDPATPVRMGRRDAMLSMPARRGYHRYFSLFLPGGARVLEYPIVLRQRSFGHSKYSPLKVFECAVSFGYLLFHERPWRRSHAKKGRARQ